MRFLHFGIGLLVISGASFGVVHAAEIVLPLPIEEVKHGIRPSSPNAAPMEIASLAFDTVATLTQTRLSTYSTTFGDTDQDGFREIVAAVFSPPNNHLKLGMYEEQGQNTYSATIVVEIGEIFEPYFTGDLDKDGKMEVLGHYGSRLRLFESADGSSYPTQLAWESPLLSNVLGAATQGDTDRDGRQELIHSLNYFGGTGSLLIFENTGDNAFTQVFQAPLPGSGNAFSGTKVVFDLDGDGWDEIAMSSKLGTVLVYEADGDNSWSLVWSDSTGMANAQKAAGGWDLDGNGKSELYVAGNNFANDTWDTHVYEAVGDNQYTLRTVLQIPYAASGSPPAVLADLDGDGDGEYITNARDLWVFDAEWGGTWAPLGSYVADAVPYCHDLNRNGRSEIVLVGAADTPILQLSVPVDTISPRAARARLTIAPNPFHGETTVVWSPSTQVGCKLVVYDVTGHLVESRRLGGSPFVWSARTLPSGIYFVRLVDPLGRPLASGRAVASR